jgi:hypothetical protein
MIKRYFLPGLLILLSGTQLKAQQYGLFNTRTLFDAFENPAQKAFVLDSSRKYASNFLLPYFGLNAANKGNANYTVRSLINDGIYDTDGLPIGTNNRNKLIESSNIYLFMFRIFQSHKFHKELGFSWQVRSDAYVDYTNESLVLFDDFNRFTSSQAGILNGNGNAQSYHQFSLNYRENYNKRLAFGVKLSLLSGITYNKIDITHSDLTVNPALDEISARLTGTYRASFLRGDDISSKTFFPDFKNPGLSIGFGTTYTAKSGVFIMGSIKDLGFIRWNNNAHSFLVDGTATASLTNSDATGDLGDKLTDIFENSDRRKGFYTATNAKADFLVSKRYGFYTPSFILSKNLFYNGGDVVLVNNFRYNDLSLSLSPDYNLIGFMQLGMQGMYQTPNFEFFMGTDNLLKSATINKKFADNTGYTGASFYMGVGIKFGYTVEHPQNSSYMPGVGDDADQEKGFFSKIFGVFKSKK